ncbi:MAG: leucine-rich repeat domain-containing protein [Chloroflexota bacterium]
MIIRRILALIALCMLSISLTQTELTWAGLPAMMTQAEFDCSLVSEIPQSECKALLAIYNSTDGPNWRTDQGERWLETMTPCEWSDVTCENGHVTRLAFVNNRSFSWAPPSPVGLRGALPPDIMNLTHLESLNISRSNITSLPSELGTLSNLTEFSFSYSELTAVPIEITYLSSLTTLILRGNQLETLPSEIGNLSNLTTLDLYSNQLTMLPPEIGHLSNLTALDLCHNQLTLLPLEIGNLSHLTTLNVEHNQLTTLPSEIGNLSNLTTLFLRENQIETLPSEIGHLLNLTSLNLSRNRLTTLPPEIGNLSNLTKLDMRQNQLTTLPPEIGNLSNLTELYLYYNSLTTIPPEYGNLPNFPRINLSHNQLTTLPPEIGNFVDTYVMNLSNNQLTTLPPEIGNLSTLSALNLSNNQLTTLPPEIGNLLTLSQLDISNNQFTTLPPEIGHLANLTYLFLAHNKLVTLPPEMGNLASLTHLSLPSNQLTTLPEEIGHLANLVSLIIPKNHLTALPPEIGHLSKLSLLNLEKNHLTTLPPEIGHLTRLTMVSLAYNQLMTLPAEFAMLGQLTQIDLGYNRMTVTDTDWQTVFFSIKSDWLHTQTIAPVGLSATALSETEIQLTWTPIPFQEKDGYYEISVATQDGFNAYKNTTSKHSNSAQIANLSPGETYSFRIRTYTPVWEEQKNALWSGYSDIITATTLLRPDNHEPDDTCAEATTIIADSTTYEHNFHTANDIDWSMFTAENAGIYRIEAIVPTGSSADVNLVYYNNCEAQMQGQFAEPFTPSARLYINAENAGQQFYIKRQNDNMAQAGSNAQYNLAVSFVPNVGTGNEVTPGVVVIVAGRYTDTVAIQDNVHQTAMSAYDFFVSEGGTDNDVFFLATDSALTAVDGESTKSNFEFVITEWAKERLIQEEGTKVFSLYLVAHGDDDQFYLDKLRGETFTPNELNMWLTQLEADVPDLLTTIFIEGNRSGRFITDTSGSLSKIRRLVIASNNADYAPPISREGTLFSQSFLTYVQLEYNIATSFTQARQLVQTFYPRQEPLLDTNGNGIPNESEDMRLASLRIMVELGVLVTDWPPYIANVVQTSAMGAQPINLRAEVRHQDGHTAIKEVLGVIYPLSDPAQNTVLDDESLAADSLDVIEFRPDNSSPEVSFTSTYTQVIPKGMYRVVVQAHDRGGLYAQPVTLVVNTQQHHFLPVVSR